MAVTSSRVSTISFTGDVLGTQYISATANTDSPGMIQHTTLASGANTITPPTGVVVVSATLIPPSGNTQSITLKGVSGDTGIRLHNTDHTTISLHSSTATFVLTAGAEIVDFRIIYT